ncbi:MAG TPA: 4-hydroxythreonine-4-phosphate dehydrogenase PdxA [Polyangiaceae bacterium]|jgi:4-hydroxythreonine-4-phosphate dehydrogenase|nr:4-hydroxythreonine-4-phosphate dehydrogenase PdxA [Polyangiaceae bacterium]
MLVVSTGCPSGIGPEVSLLGAAALPRVRTVLVGDEGTLRGAAKRVGVSATRLVPFAGPQNKRRPRGAIEFVTVGPELSEKDRRPGHPSKRAGRAQLAYVEEAYRLAKAIPGAAIVSGPVSKSAIAHSGAPGAESFRGHTEWLRDLDRAEHAVMCFASPTLVTSLVTTHLPLHEVPKALDEAGVAIATTELVRLLHALGKKRPLVAVTSLNPHAGESELLGFEEAKAIVPGIRLARRRAGRGATLVGPVGAETAYRLAHAGRYDGVVAMYHDQATIPMKLVAFGDAVNVTMGLSIVRTSVDHGTGYDIAWTGKADPSGMIAAMKLAARLVG